ncbi:CD276 antigen homolog [Seriola dumerili]|uniref:CD276 antigen homolog n=1 Tax=Seriola dumerili TaxID=41447 RepID=UPI000BBE3672|nr:CD276 antigen homolog [Seriola dumerili]
MEEASQLLVQVRDDRLTIVAHREQDVTLPCQTRSGAAIIAAEWSRPDQESHYVFFYRDDQADKTHQHPSFENRVELADGRMKDGNLSLILRDVRRSDHGTYECRVKQETAARRKRAFISAEPISIVDLRVTESHHVMIVQMTRQPQVKLVNTLRK